MALPPIQIEITADPRRAVSGMDAVGDASDKLGRRVSRSSGQVQKVSRSFGDLSGKSRQLAPQLSQVLQQFTATGNLGQAVAVQAADIGLAFGVVGTAVGALAGIALPSLLAAFSGTSMGASELEEALDKLDESFGDVDEAIKLAQLSAMDLGEEFGGLRIRIEEMIAAKGAIALRNMADAANELRDELVAMYNGNAWLNVSRAEDLANGLNLSTRGSRELAAALVALGQEQTLEGQVELVSQMRKRFEEMVGSADQMTAAQFDFFTQVVDTEAAMRRVLDRVGDVEAELQASEGAAQLLLNIADNLPEVFDSAADSAGDIAANLWDAAEAAFETAKAQAAIIAAAEKRGGGRGADPRQFGFGAGDLAAIQIGGGAISTEIPGAPRRAGGGGGQDGIQDLIDSLQTEREIIDTWYADSLERLNNANAAELEVIGGHNEAKLRLEQEYQERLQGMRTGYNGDALTQAGTFFGDMATALQGGNEKLQKIGEKFAKAEAVVNAIRAYSQVAADPSLPWFAKIPAALSVASAVTSAASSLRGGGGGATPPSGSQAQGGPPRQDSLLVRLNGSGSIPIQEIPSLFNMLQDEAGDRNLVFARR